MSLKDVESQHYDLFVTILVVCAMCDDFLLDLLVRWTVRLVHALLCFASSQRTTCIWGFDALRWDILSIESCHVIVEGNRFI